MTRVSAANGDSCPIAPIRALNGEASFRSAAAWTRRPARALERMPLPSVGPAVRWPRIPSAAFIGVAIAIFGVVALTLQHLRLERDLAFSAGAREVGMRATLLAERLDAALSARSRSSRKC